MQALRVVVFGLGGRISGVLKGFIGEAPQVQIVGYVDPAPMGAQALIEAGIDIGTAYSDTATALAEAKPDVVFVGSPNHLHFQHINEALDAGVRVFSEKPVVRNRAETVALTERLKNIAPQQLIVGLVLRSSSLFQTVLDEVRQLGKVISMEANEILHYEHGGFLMRDWRRFDQFSGGHMLEKCCHDIDLHQAILGAPIVRVASFGDRNIFVPEHRAMADEPGSNKNIKRYHAWPQGWDGAENHDVFSGDGDAVDNQVAIAEAANGARLTFHTNCHAAFHQRRWLIAGLNGTIEADLATGIIKVQHNSGEERTIDTNIPGQSHYGADAQMSKDLKAALIDGQPFPVNAQDALAAGLSAMAMDEARKAGSVVDISAEQTALQDSLRPADALASPVA